MVSIVLKIPLLCIQAYCARTAVKPPNPPPAAEDEKRHTTRNKIPEPFPGFSTVKHFRYPFYLYTFAEVAIIALSLMRDSLPALSHNLPDAQKIALSNVYLFGFLCMCTGAAIRGACYRRLGHLFTFQLSLKKEHRLVTDGPYSVVRHPSYVGSCFFYIGACCAQLGRGSWLTANGVWDAPLGRVLVFLYFLDSVYTCTFLIMRVKNEDLALKREYGQQWENWAKKTPYRLIPFVY